MKTDYRKPIDDELPSHLCLAGNYFPITWDKTDNRYGVVQFEGGEVPLSKESMQIMFGDCFRVEFYIEPWSCTGRVIDVARGRMTFEVNIGEGQMPSLNMEVTCTENQK